ncbi:response regulator [Candidatus Villigracilis saccharophilus]|uniref:response regulator n=1 Tax=Candidatus Villigracilis saccharophilus TaxID=3140684 RepID=UPI003135AFB3|nr:response regulator [Anaerolineales bacterium]
MDNIKILLIDKDKTSRKFLAQMLIKKNYQVIHADTGRDGVEKAAHEQPDLIIFDTNLDDLAAKELIEMLQKKPSTALIPAVVLSSQSTPDEMQECMQAGCAEYYVKSGMVTLTLVNAIPKILLEKKREHPEKKDGLIIVFLSANGGIGTSSLCANIAMNVAQQIHPSTVGVVDLVLPMGSLAEIVGAHDTDFNIIKVSEMPAEAMTPGYFQSKMLVPPQWLVHLLPGSPDPAMSNHLVVENISGIFYALKKTYDYTFVDLGRTLSKISLPIIHEADLIVLIVGTNQSTVHLTKKAWNYLLDQGIQKHKLFPILNRAVGLEGLTKAEAENFLGFEIKLTIPYMMGNFALANNQNTPIGLKFPNDTVSIMLKQAAFEISKQAIKVQDK